MTPGPENDPRLLGSTRIGKGALLFFKDQPGARGCKVTDVTNRDAGIRTHNLSVLPTSFVSRHGFREIAALNSVAERAGAFVFTKQFSAKCVAQMRNFPSAIENLATKIEAPLHSLPFEAGRQR